MATRRPILDADPTVTGMLSAPLPQIAVPFEVPVLDSSADPIVEPSASLTKKARTFLGVGSGTAIGSEPENDVAWKSCTRACALMKGTREKPMIARWSAS